MSELKIRLLADRVLVEVIKPAEQKTASGIILPEAVIKSQEKSLQGKVLKVSKKIEDCEVEEDKVYTGNIVLFSQYAGTDLLFEDKEYKVLRITDVIAEIS